jgi:hypothetical protein
LRTSRDTRGFGRLCWFGRSRCSASLGIGVNTSYHLIRDHHIAIRFDMLGKNTGSRRWDLEHDLVGLDFDENFVLCYSLARLFFPLKKCSLSNRFRKLRNFNVM